MPDERLKRSCGGSAAPSATEASARGGCSSRRKSEGRKAFSSGRLSEEGTPGYDHSSRLPLGSASSAYSVPYHFSRCLGLGLG